MNGEVFVMKTGGFASLFTVIEVTYPSGSICTCGGKAAKDTSGHALFPVKAGTYTVECHTSDNSKSKSTSITVAESDKGKCKSITLTYELVLFDNGTVGGYTWTGLTNNGTTLSLGVENSTGYGSTASGSSVQTIDMRDYTTLKFHVVSSNTTGSYSGGVTLGTDGATVNFKNESNVIKAVNISNISSGKILFSVSANSAAVGGTQSCTVVVNKIWLE